MEKRGTSLLKKLLSINIGVLMIAVGIYFFKAPNGFATGGVSGIAIVLAKLPFSLEHGITSLQSLSSMISYFLSCRKV